MTYNLGIDIGIASIGFAGVGLNRILYSGVHIFEAAEHPKNGASLAKPRRDARGQRRVIKRRAQRKGAVRRLLVKHGLEEIQAIDAPECSPPKKSVWDLRKEALERKLTDGEFARVLFHITKRRGFQSNRKGPIANDTEDKKALNGAKDLQVSMISVAANTVGAYLATLSKKRNGAGSYERFVTRDLLREEVEKIFFAQKKFGNLKATTELLDAYAGSGKLEERNTYEGDGIAFFQRPLQSSEHLVGFCTLEPEEKRAPKFSYTAELFILWGKLNNIKIKDITGKERFLTKDEKYRLSEKAHTLKKVSYIQARKELQLSDDERFNISYRKIEDDDDAWEKIRDTSETRKVFLNLSGLHSLKAILGADSTIDWQKWMSTDRDKLDRIAWILSFHEDKKQVDELLSDLDLSKEQIKLLSEITNFSKTINLSLKAVHNILPYMQDGLTYDKACKEAGYNHSHKENKGLNKIPPFQDVQNPVVNRALAQTRKVINACIQKHGMPEIIIVELAREVNRSFNDRKKIEKEQEKNQAHREDAKKHIAEILGIPSDNVSGKNILKYRLWKEQEAMCCYCGAEMTPETLSDSVATQIDHIIPYRRSWNDSYMNKVLCHTHCNQEKRNHTPYEWLGGTSLWNAVESFARRLPQKKAENILIENFDEEKGKQWKDRALNDTRYMAKLLKSHLEESLNLGKGNHIQARNGSLTFRLRGAWGFPDKDRTNDRHHALDAIVLACSTQNMVKQFAEWDKYKFRKKNPVKRPMPPRPWETFREDAQTSVENLFVSRMPARKITGEAHQDTIRKIRKTDGKIIDRIKLAKLSLSKLETLVDKKRNIKLYTVLKERLTEYGGNEKKAFAEPIYMPTNTPSKQGPRINSVRIVTKEKSGIRINKGLASNGDMVRVDVFQKDKKYFLVPIYAYQFVCDQLPNKAILSDKDEKDWLEMEDRDFIFSLYKNDLIKIKSKKEEYFAYYIGTDRSNARITICAHDRDPSFGSTGTKRSGSKTLLALEKYSVDYFGKKHRIRKEIRVGVAHNNDSKTSKAKSETRTTSTGK